MNKARKYEHLFAAGSIDIESVANTIMNSITDFNELFVRCATMPWVKKIIEENNFSSAVHEFQFVDGSVIRFICDFNGIKEIQSFQREGRKI